MLDRLYNLRYKYNSDQQLDEKIVAIMKVLPKSLRYYKFVVNLENLESLKGPDSDQD